MAVLPKNTSVMIAEWVEVCSKTSTFNFSVLLMETSVDKVALKRLLSVIVRYVKHMRNVVF
jgi:hypothetical protein